MEYRFHWSFQGICELCSCSRGTSSQVFGFEARISWYLKLDQAQGSPRVDVGRAVLPLRIALPPIDHKVSAKVMHD